MGGRNSLVGIETGWEMEQPGRQKQPAGREAETAPGWWKQPAGRCKEPGRWK